MLGSFSRSPLQAHTGDPNDHILVSPARGTTPYSHKPGDAILYSEVASADDCQMLQSDLNKLTKWEEKWLMSFNSSKCEVLTVTRKKQLTLFNYSMHAQIQWLIVRDSS